MVSMRAMSQLTIGSVFAGHRIDGIAGRGGMGVVYRATELGVDRSVALKLLSPELAEDAEFRERFRQESSIAAAVANSHVIPIFRVGEEAGALFFTMPFIDAADLRGVLAVEGRLAPALAAEVTAQVASALDAVHARGLVHRDLKPSNILLDGPRSDPHVYVTDFGLAKHVAALSKPGWFMSTSDYLAPEAIQDETVDARLDVYALGCILYEALTGRSPYDSAEGVQLLAAHMEEPPPKVEVDGVPEPFDAVIARAMAKNRDERYLSAGDLGRAATAAAAGRSMSRTERNVATGAAAPSAANAVGEGAPPVRGAGPPPASPPPLRPPEHRELSVFISYRRQDSQPQANGLYDGLSHRLPDARIFMDIDSIPAGVDFQEHIQGEIEGCDVVLVLIGEDWLAHDGSGERRIDNPEDLVRLEVAAALERRIPTVPVLVEGARMPRSDELPADVARLARINAIEVSDSRWRGDLERVTRVIRDLVS